MRYKDIFNLNGRVAVVTGGDGLLGQEFVQGLVEFGACVVSADIKCLRDNPVSKGLNCAKIISMPVDITRESSVDALIRQVSKRNGHIDIWINNAYPRTEDWGNKFEKIKLSSWRKNVNMHLGGYFICSQKIAEYMKSQGSGVIVNIASIYGVISPDFSIYEGTNMTMPAAYSVIKAGIINFTRYLASYYGSYNIRVNCVSPGGVFDKQPSSFIKRYSQKSVIKRMADRQDLVGGVIFLVSDAAQYITGHNLVIDGGFSII